MKYFYKTFYEDYTHRTPFTEKSLKDMVYKELTYKKNSHDKLLKIAYFLMTFGENLDIPTFLRNRNS